MPFMRTVGVSMGMRFQGRWVTYRTAPLMGIHRWRPPEGEYTKFSSSEWSSSATTATTATTGGGVAPSAAARAATGERGQVRGGGGAGGRVRPHIPGSRLVGEYLHVPVDESHPPQTLLVEARYEVDGLPREVGEHGGVAARLHGVLVEQHGQLAVGDGRFPDAGEEGLLEDLAIAAEFVHLVEEGGGLESRGGGVRLD